MTLILGLNGICSAQNNNNPCQLRWTQWANTPIRRSDGGVYYKVQYSKCGKSTGICGYPKIGLQHTFPYDEVSIEVGLEGYDCDGNPSKSSFPGTDIAPSYGYVSQGNWHTFQRVTGVYLVDVRYKKEGKNYILRWTKETGRVIVTINGYSESEWEQRKAQEKAQSEKSDNQHKTNHKKEEDNDRRTANDNAHDQALESEKIEKNKKIEEEKKQKEIDAQRRKEKLQQEEQERLARQKAYEDSVRNEARKARIENVKKNDEAEDRVYYSAASAIASGALLLDDKFMDEESNLKAHLGLGLEAIPSIANEHTTRKSTVESALMPSVYAGIEGRLNLTSSGGIAITGLPFLQYNIAALSTGLNGSSMTLGMATTLTVAAEATSKLHFFGEGAYFNRSGAWSYDFDAVLGTTTDQVQFSSFDYTVLRFGGGVKLQFVSDSETETYLKPGFFLENITNVPEAPLIMSANLQFMISSALMFEVAYSNNYFVAGDLRYRTGFAPASSDFFSIKIIRKGLLAPTD